MPSASPSKSKAPKRRLGRGLGSLLNTPVALDVDAETSDRSRGAEPSADPTAATGPTADSGSDVPTATMRMVAVADVDPNPRQPRQVFDDGAIATLADSIRTAGLMQPVVVRPGDDGRFQLVAGERRWRAATSIGLERIPAVVRDIDDRTATEWALIENIQREDLNPIDRAEAFARLAADFDMTHQEIAECVGLDRSSISNHLRLLELDEDTRQAVQANQLGLGHAKALLGITNLSTRKQLAAATLKEGWSVRELERRARAAPSAGGTKPPTAAPPPANIQDLQRRLGEHLGTKVEVHLGRKKGHGRLTVHFYGIDQFEGLLSQMGFSADG